MGNQNLKQNKKIVKLNCPICDHEIQFTIPAHIFAKKHSHYPFTFRFVHGTPPHTVSLYIDKNGTIRGKEFDDSVLLSEQVFDQMRQLDSITQTNQKTENYSKRFNLTLPYIRTFHHPELVEAHHLYEKFQYQDALNILINFAGVDTLSRKEKNSFYKLYHDLLYSFGLYEDALKTANWIVNQSKRTNNLWLMIDGGIEESRSKLRLGKLEESYAGIKKAEKMLKFLSNEYKQEKMIREIQIHYVKGWYYWQIGELEHALEEALLQLEKSKNFGTKRDIALALLLLGVFYMEKGQYSESLLFTKQSLNIGTEIEDKMHMARASNNIGEIYRIQGKLELSLQYYQKSRHLNELIQDTRELAINHVNLALIYFEKQQWEQARNFVLKSLHLQENLKDQTLYAESLLILVRIAINEKQQPHAQKNLQKLRQLSDGTGLLRIKYRFELAQSLILKESKSLVKKIEARIRLKDLLKNKVVEYEIRLIALINLIEVLIFELKTTQDEEILLKIQNVVQNLIQLAQQKYLYRTLFHAYKIQSQVAIINLNLKKAMDAINNAVKIAEDYHLDSLKKQGQQLFHYYQQNQKQWQSWNLSEITLSERLTYLSLPLELSLKQSIDQNQKSTLLLSDPLFFQIKDIKNFWVVKYDFEKSWSRKSQFLSLIEPLIDLQNGFYPKHPKKIVIDDITVYLQSLGHYILFYIVKKADLFALAKLDYFKKEFKKLEKIDYKNTLSLIKTSFVNFS